MIESPRVMVTSDLPGADKSSVARLLAQQFPRGAHFEADVLQNMIVSGASWPDPDLTPESERQLRLRVTHGCQLADSFATAGFCAVLDDIFIGDRIAHLLSHLHTRPSHFVMLNPALQTLMERNATRAKRDAFHQSKSLFEIVQSQTPRIGLWLDTSALDATQTVENILASLPSAVAE